MEITLDLKHKQEIKNKEKMADLAKAAGDAARLKEEKENIEKQFNELSKSN